MEDYDALVEKAFKELPETVMEKERFKMPVFEAFVQGNQTIIQNFIDVTTALRRDEKHLMKYLSNSMTRRTVLILLSRSTTIQRNTITSKFMTLRTWAI